MKFTKEMQYALLLVLYLSRSGRSTLQTVSDELNISQTFLEQIARKLRISDLLKSVKGPGGGYQVLGEPSVNDVLSALKPKKRYNMPYNASGSSEKRALGWYLHTLHTSYQSLLKRKVSSLNMDLAANEVATMETLSLAEVPN